MHFQSDCNKCDLFSVKQMAQVHFHAQSKNAISCQTKCRECIFYYVENMSQNRATNSPNRFQNIPKRFAIVPKRFADVPNRLAYVPHRHANVPNLFQNTSNRFACPKSTCKWPKSICKCPKPTPWWCSSLQIMLCMGRVVQCKIASSIRAFKTWTEVNTKVAPFYVSSSLGFPKVQFPTCVFTRSCRVQKKWTAKIVVCQKIKKS